MMARITVVTSNQKYVHLNSIYRADEIDSTVETIREQLHSLLDKDVAQETYNKRYKLTPDDLVQEFNGDMLYIAIGIRDYGDDYEAVAKDTGIDPLSIRAIEAGLLTPAKVHVERMSKCFNFPYDFFTREGKVDRNHEFTWMGEPGAYDRWLAG